MESFGVVLQLGGMLVSSVGVVIVLRNDLKWIKEQLTAHIVQDEQRYQFLINRTGKE